MTGSTRVLVLGGTGMLGHVLLRELSPRFEIYGSVRQFPESSVLEFGGDLIQADAEKTESLEAAVARVRPQVVVNAIGVIKQLEAANDAETVIRLNSLLPHTLSRICREHDSRLIHVSTDCVFSGALKPPLAYKESDCPDPSDLYGRSKWLGELSEGNTLTLRTSIIGWELQRISGLIEWFVSEANASGTGIPRKIEGYVNAIFSGVTTSVLAGIIGELIKNHQDLRGLWHVASDPINKYDLLMGLVSRLSLNVDLIPTPEPRINRALDSSRLAAATGLRAPAWDEMLDSLAKEHQ